MLGLWAILPTAKSFVLICSVMNSGVDECKYLNYQNQTEQIDHMTLNVEYDFSILCYSLSSNYKVCGSAAPH